MDHPRFYFVSKIRSIFVVCFISLLCSECKVRRESQLSQSTQAEWRGEEPTTFVSSYGNVPTNSPIKKIKTHTRLGAKCILNFVFILYEDHTARLIVEERAQSKTLEPNLINSATFRADYSMKLPLGKEHNLSELDDIFLFYRYKYSGIGGKLDRLQRSHFEYMESRMSIGLQWKRKIVTFEPIDLPRENRDAQLEVGAPLIKLFNEDIAAASFMFRNVGNDNGNVLVSIYEPARLILYSDKNLELPEQVLLADSDHAITAFYPVSEDATPILAAVRGSEIIFINQKFLPRYRVEVQIPEIQVDHIGDSYKDPVVSTALAVLPFASASKKEVEDQFFIGFQSHIPHKPEPSPLRLMAKTAFKQRDKAGMDRHMPWASYSYEYARGNLVDLSQVKTVPHIQGLGDERLQDPEEARTFDILGQATRIESIAFSYPIETQTYSEKEYKDEPKQDFRTRLAVVLTIPRKPLTIAVLEHSTFYRQFFLVDTLTAPSSDYRPDEVGVWFNNLHELMILDRRGQYVEVVVAPPIKAEYQHPPCRNPPSEVKYAQSFIGYNIPCSVPDISAKACFKNSPLSEEKIRLNCAYRTQYCTPMLYVDEFKLPHEVHYTDYISKESYENSAKKYWLGEQKVSNSRNSGLFLKYLKMAEDCYNQCVQNTLEKSKRCNLWERR